MLTTQQLNAYFERINYHGSPSISHETLHQLHRAQVMSIPFENIDVFFGRPIQLDVDSLGRNVRLSHTSQAGR